MSAAASSSATERPPQKLAQMLQQWTSGKAPVPNGGATASASTPAAPVSLQQAAGPASTATAPSTPVKSKPKPRPKPAAPRKTAPTKPRAKPATKPKPKAKSKPKPKAAAEDSESNDDDDDNDDAEGDEDEDEDEDDDKSSSSAAAGPVEDKPIKLPDCVVFQREDGKLTAPELGTSRQLAGIASVDMGSRVPMPVVLPTEMIRPLSNKTPHSMQDWLKMLNQHYGGISPTSLGVATATATDGTMQKVLYLTSKAAGDYGPEVSVWFCRSQKDVKAVKACVSRWIKMDGAVCQLGAQNTYLMEYIDNHSAWATFGELVIPIWPLGAPDAMDKDGIAMTDGDTKLHISYQAGRVRTTTMRVVSMARSLGLYPGADNACIGCAGEREPPGEDLAFSDDDDDGEDDMESEDEAFVVPDHESDTDGETTDPDTDAQEEMAAAAGTDDEDEEETGDDSSEEEEEEEEPLPPPKKQKKKKVVMVAGKKRKALEMPKPVAHTKKRQRVEAVARKTLKKKKQKVRRE